MLDEAARAHPDTWWWIKADGTDVVSGLGESVGGTWSGDVDLADGKLAKTREQYEQRLKFLNQLGESSLHGDPLEIIEECITAERSKY